MTSDDQHFLDILSSFPNHILHYSLEVADSVDRFFDRASDHLRDGLADASWLPASARPAPTPRPSPLLLRGTGGRPSALLWPLNRVADSRVGLWAAENRALVAGLLAFVGTGGYLVYRRRRAYARKRRARRHDNGRRRDVVVVAGTANSPISRSIVLDLERRGFVVYVLVNSEHEEHLVKTEGKLDILPLQLNVADPFDVEQSLAHFTQTLAANPSYPMSLAGLVLIPDITYSTGPIETTAPEVWSDTLNTRVLHTVATAQAFLRALCDYQARLLVLTPSIISSLRPPFHGLEATAVAALEGFTASLRGELRTLGVPVCHLKLGSFECGTLAGRSALQRSSATDVLAWPPAARASYSRNYLQGTDGGHGFDVVSARSAAPKGSSLRELNNAVFDALTQKNPRAVLRVGRGSVLYDYVSHVVPPGIVGWMMGIRRVDIADQKSELKAQEQNAQWQRV